MINEPFCATEIIFSNKNELEKKLLCVDAKCIVLVMSKSSALRWKMSPFIEKLRERCEFLKGTLIWIENIASNPTQKDLLEALKQIGNVKVEMIIACGGGSSIDLAKGISALLSVLENNDYTIDTITDIIRNAEYKGGKFADIIAVPTTAGTGSEVTQWATIWDEKKLCKFSIDDPLLKPKFAFIVPELTASMTPQITLSTGFDAISHAIEAYWSKHTTPLVQEIAYRAIEIVIKNLKIAVEQPDNVSVREKLCKASVLAGLAFSHTRTTACHSISYPLTMLYGIPHGFAAAITLDAVGRINKGHFPNDNDLFKLFSEYGGIMEWVDSVSEDVAIMRLSTFGINKNDVPIIVEKAFTSGRMDNNPVNLSKSDVRNILLGLLND